MQAWEKDQKLARRYLAKAQSSRDRGIAFKLSITSYKNLMSAKTCYYTGIALSDMEGASDQRTIDRIDNNRPYESGNVVACCLEFNQMKARMETDGLIHLQSFQRAVVKMFKTVNETKAKRLKNSTPPPKP